ncbi:MAG: hypothetical protein HETSPECPRED_002153 [Heterodermia speciosa]|uniref:Plastid lipid-associated protein/fibrillin conserved domain-containing protein n=1 Tax=Heterodermia speciosa TaxID=116794 RepID=A0A8H3PGX4_9LECA|nr:MAG: hypothetical protein HETSPECPRED_002153 [Heterodermia speciosa]
MPKFAPQIGPCLTWLLAGFSICRGSPLIDPLPDAGNITGPRSSLSSVSQLTANFTLQEPRIGPYNSSQPLSARRWPATIAVPGIPEFVVKLDNVIPLSDTAQILDIKSALADLRNTVCTQGDRVYREFRAHTLSEQSIDCRATAATIEGITALTTGALSAIIFGQIVHGPAAVSAQLWHVEYDFSYGYIEGSVREPSPPMPPQKWPSAVLNEIVSGSPGQHLRIESQGPTLDNWDRLWFTQLCGQTIQKLKREGKLSDRVSAFHEELQPQGIQFSFIPSPSASLPPTRATVISVMRVLSYQVFRPYGARLVRITLLDAGGQTLGLGSFQMVNEGGVVRLTAGSGNSSLATDS